jgi:hypothetical protein
MLTTRSFLLHNQRFATDSLNANLYAHYFHMCAEMGTTTAGECPSQSHKFKGICLNSHNWLYRKIISWSFAQICNIISCVWTLFSTKLNHNKIYNNFEFFNKTNGLVSGLCNGEYLYDLPFTCSAYSLSILKGTPEDFCRNILLNAIFPAHWGCHSEWWLGFLKFSCAAASGVTPSYMIFRGLSLYICTYH